MMAERFIEIMINVNIRAIVIICVVLLLRLIFAKLHISKKYVSLLWLLPYLCLMMPWRLESSFSVWGVFSGFENVMEQNNRYAEKVPIHSPVPISNENATEDTNTIVVIEEEAEKTAQNNTTDRIQEKTGSRGLAENVVLIVWLLGMIVTMLYSIIFYSRLHKKVLCSICVQDNIYYADDIAVPFVLGIIHPKIYLPANRKQENLQYVLEHEKTHILRWNPLKKTAAFLITGIHWFNPFVWIAFYFLGKDMEMACDEETIQRIGLDKRWDYADTLLRLTSGKQLFMGMNVPLSFGEGDVKGRIQNILIYKKTTGIPAGMVVVMIGILCAVFLTDPESLQMDRTSKPDVQKSVQTSIQESVQANVQASTEEYNEEFTMENLIALCNKERVEFKKVWDDLIATEGAAYRNFEYSDGGESLTANYSCSLTYNEKEYELQVYFWKKDAAIECGYEPYELDAVRIYETSSGDALLLYTSEPQDYIENRNIQSFLGQEYDITQYLTVDLPEGLTMGAFQQDINDSWDGCIFQGDFEEPAHGDGCSESWYAPGGIEVLKLDVPAGESDRAIFENDRLQGIVWMLNHAGWTDYEVLEGCQMQAVISEYSFQLFTAAESQEYWEKNGMTEEEFLPLANSKYWYVFFAEPDSEYLYTVYLNQKYFTREDVVALAKSVNFK